MAKNKILSYLVYLSTSALLLFSACTQEQVVNVNPVCFEKDVLPIFISNCTQSGCHNSIDREEGIELTSYASIVSNGIAPGDYAASKLYQVLIAVGEELMPQKPYNKLSAEQITTIALWIDQGAKNTTCASTGNCDVSKVTYAKTVKPIMDRSCNGCHAGSAPSGNINLSNYTGVKKYALDGSLFGSINHDAGFVRMPDGASKLPSCEISSIKEWIRLGALNN
ncbi:MAG TPA: hypothetical protein PLC89_00135 [Haliscomenobacter sp.]|uniref:hypothetical protein n=1 Tax=Haliscomenobacter sp. TaxID=2717303 RepID=UPI002C128F1E|nr:hypothetical protein [Haliscomenobacter sp.]HOY15659.1 hypothetical protein [Haliscomenobacter sp.]